MAGKYGRNNQFTQRSPDLLRYININLVSEVPVYAFIKMKKLIEISDVSAGYDNNIVLRNINLEIFEQDFIGIIGPNGGGKTTLLRVILGLIKPVKGSIKYYTEEIDKNTKLLGYLPQISQIDNKFPISVFDVVYSGLISRDGLSLFSSGNRKKRTEEILIKMGIFESKKKAIGELSGGQLQRVFLGRAIIASPKILILDEPHTYVDSNFENELDDILIKLNQEMTIIIVSHDVGTIFSYVKTIACVNGNLYYHTSNEISQELLASYNCPIDILTHGEVPHRVLRQHKKT